MDNRKLSINGKSDDMLKKALSLAFHQASFSESQSHCVCWNETEQDGLVLSFSRDKDSHPFPVPLSSDGVFPIVKQWLNGDFAQKVIPNEGSENLDHDGDNELGWEVYFPQETGVGDSYFVICAIKPAYLWMGK